MLALIEASIVPHRTLAPAHTSQGGRAVQPEQIEHQRAERTGSSRRRSGISAMQPYDCKCSCDSKVCCHSLKAGIDG
jgi:hypothetical protein